MSYKHLTPEERGKIEAWLIDSVNQSEIALRLGRHRSTILREIERNSEARSTNNIAYMPYRATNAHNLATLRKKTVELPLKQNLDSWELFKNFKLKILS